MTSKLNDQENTSTKRPIRFPVTPSKAPGNFKKLNTDANLSSECGITSKASAVNPELQGKKTNAKRPNEIIPNNNINHMITVSERIEKPEISENKIKQLANSYLNSKYTPIQIPGQSSKFQNLCQMFNNFYSNNTAGNLKESSHLRDRECCAPKQENTEAAANFGEFSFNNYDKNLLFGKGEGDQCLNVTVDYDEREEYANIIHCLGKEN